MTTRRLKALIIGGGIAGLAAALALQKAGITVTVFERTSELREEGTGIPLAANGSLVLTELGLGPALHKVAVPLEEIQVRSATGAAFFTLPVSPPALWAKTKVYGIDRRRLLTLLAQGLDPQAVRCGAKCIGFQQHSSGVVAHFSDGSSAEGDLLLGADGLRSTIRAQLIGTRSPTYAGYVAYRGMTRSQEFSLPRAIWTIGHGSQFLTAPMGENRLFWYASMNAQAFDSAVHNSRRERLLRLFRGWHSPIPHLIESTAESDILLHRIYSRPAMLHRWGSGVVSLLGDAAHPMTPTFGQGGCQGLEDAICLQRHLAGCSHIPTALRAYERSRASRAAYVANCSNGFGSILQWQDPLCCWLRDVVIRLIPQWVYCRFVWSLCAREL